MILAAFFVAAASLAFLGLCAVALPDVPKISGTVALVLTLTALGVAVLR